MKNVMTRAWEIAKEAVVNFGGKVKEYFAMSLRMAWSEIKKGVDKMSKLQELYELKNESDFEEFKATQEKNYSNWSSMPGEEKTFDQYIQHFIDLHHKVAERAKKVEARMEEARKPFAKFDKNYDYMGQLEAISEIKSIRSKLTRKERDAILSEAYTKAAAEMQAKVKDQSVMEDVAAVSPGITGPIYDNDSKPTYF